ncbi:hypothetical protein FRX31_009301, partial [Thalictrum thalictroides]
FIGEIPTDALFVIKVHPEHMCNLWGGHGNPLIIECFDFDSSGKHELADTRVVCSSCKYVLCCLDEPEFQLQTLKGIALFLKRVCSLVEEGS